MELVRTFEIQLKNRLSQKTTQHTSEESQLNKVFKYFDLNNSGAVSRKEFQRVLENLGVWLNDEQELDVLFKYYDQDQSGELDYGEFIGRIYNLRNNSRLSSARQQDRQQGNYSVKSMQQPGDMQTLLEKLRASLHRRGGKSIIGLGRQFRIMDDNGNRRLDSNEMSNALHDYGVQLDRNESDQLFQYFDGNQDGQVDYDEFLVMIRGPLNSFRAQFVQQAFNKLDKTGNGKVEVDDLIEVYNVEKHPDYINGKKTKEQVLREFMSTFEQYSDLKGLGDGVVTQEEFMDYYNFISASIDDDQYFELMMNNCWRINSGDHQNWNKKGWSNQQDNITNNNNNNNSNSKSNSTLQTAYQKNAAQSRGVNTPFGTNNQTKPQQQQPNRSAEQLHQSVNQLMDSLRKKIASRGTNGIFSLGRLFRNIDDNRSGSLELEEFSKCMKEFRLNMSQQDVQLVYQQLDRDGNGSISYDEFLRGVRGQMNQGRVKVVRQAFNKLDADKSGIVDIQDLKGVYNAKCHPEVRAGKKTEDEILGEFLDTFEQHHAQGQQGKGRDGRVTFEEFVEYYNNISCSVDNDEYFDLMIKNAWQLDNHNKSYGRGWANQL